MIKKSRELVISKGHDYSRNSEPQLIPIEPLAYDKDTGEVLNKTLETIYKEGTPINIQDNINSYRDDADVYNILRKAVKTNDYSALNARQGSYLDVSDIPDNIHDLTDYYKKQSNIIAKATDQDKADALSTKSIQDIVDERIKLALESKNTEVKSDE